MLLVVLLVAAAGSAIAARTGYFQAGRYYASPAGVVAWMRVSSAAIIVSDLKGAVASIARSNGVVAWSHHPSGGRIDTLRLSGDGRTLAVAGVELEVLDTQTGKIRWAQRLGCKRPCENRVQWVTDNAVFVSGSGVTHQWLWRYDVTTGKQVWAKPLAVAHPRSFVGTGETGWLLEANAPFGIRQLDLVSPRTVARSLWTPMGRQGPPLAARRINGVGDGRLLLVGPLPGGGLPPIALASAAQPQPVDIQLVNAPVLMGARVTRLETLGGLVGALGRRKSGAHAMAVWHVDRPDKLAASVESATPITVTTSTDSARGGRADAMVVTRQVAVPTPSVELVAVDGRTGSKRFGMKVASSGRPRVIDVGEGTQAPSVALITVPKRSSGPIGAIGSLAIIDTAKGGLVGVGVVERGSQVYQVQRTPTGLYVGAGRGVYSLLKVPIARAFAELEQEEQDAGTKALREALHWVPAAAPRLAKLALEAARKGARSLSRQPVLKRLRTLRSLVSASVTLPPAKLHSQLSPLLTSLAGVALVASASERGAWEELAKTLEVLALRKDLTPQSLHAVRGLVILTAIGLKSSGAPGAGMRLMNAWLARPTLSEPGEEALRQALALAALDTLFAGQVGALSGVDDGKRHAAARLLSAFEGAKFALGDGEWLVERAGPVLTPSRPESMGAAAALAQELSKVLQSLTQKGRLALSGPGCALTCRVLETACTADCHGAACQRRQKGCLKRCKRKRSVKFNAKSDACRAP